MSGTASLPFDTEDPRWLAFRSPEGPEVFHSVVSTRDIWKADPFDVEEIHADAREVFERTVARIHNSPPSDSPLADNLGKIFLLRGESGAGKTHLMRAFRHRLHSQGLGWFVYLQMTTVIGHYPLYILRNLVESFSQPYDLSRGADESGWLRLSNFLVEHPAVPPDLRAELRDGPDETCAKTVAAIADHLLDTPHFVRGGADYDLVRAMLFFQRCEPAFSRLVITYLRCEPLRRADIERLGELYPRTADVDPLEMLVNIGRLVHLFEKQSLVVCLDQLEEIWTDGPEGKQRFRDAMNAVRSFTDKHPGALVVISCLDDYYIKLRELIALDKPLLDRIESVPPVPVNLESNRSRNEVEQIISQRLECLYQYQKTDFREDQRLFPFEPEDVGRLASFRPRGILHACLEARERSVRTGSLPRIGGKIDLPGPGPTPKPNLELIILIQQGEQAWNDFRNSFTQSPPAANKDLAALLAWGIEECNAELDTPLGGERFAARALEAFVQVDAPPIPGRPRRWLARIANAAAPGGKLSVEIKDVTTTAQQCQPPRAPVAVRASAFPGKAGSKIAQQLGEMVSKNQGRKVVIEDSEWRAILALREFLPGRADEAATAAWRSAEKPLSRLPGLRVLLLLDELPVTERPPVTVLTPSVAGTDPTQPKKDGTSNGQPSADTQERDDPQFDPVKATTGPAVLGATREKAAKPVSIEAKELTRHAAVIGGTGSGKTTTVLTLIENLLLRGVPAILLDRKGDLASYARPESWTAPLTPEHGPDAAARRRLLRERLDVQLFTPGAPSGGRPLGISLLPRGVGRLPGPEREAAARAAAASLAGMMKYGAGAAAQKLAVLGKAILTLAELEPDAEITLLRLTDFVAEEDESLVNALGYLDPKLLPKVKTDLATFDASQGYLLAPGGERVSAERLFGLGGEGAPAAGKTRLSIISTKFFDNNAGALFWTAQFLLEMARFAAKQPSDTLQGVVLFDEADMYLPAVGKPVTKEPMENALRRWRSAGLGVLLASQNPGDFDYKCRDNVRTWFVGKVGQDRAISKMRPMLREAKTDIAAKLPGLETGQFFLVRDASVESLAVYRSLIDAQQMPDAEILRLASGGG